MKKLWIVLLLALVVGCEEEPDVHYTRPWGDIYAEQVEPNEPIEPKPCTYTDPNLSTDIIGQTQMVCSRHGRLGWGEAWTFNNIKTYCGKCFADVIITYLDKHIKGIAMDCETAASPDIEFCPKCRIYALDNGKCPKCDLSGN